MAKLSNCHPTQILHTLWKSSISTYRCFFPSLSRILTRKRNICRRHFSVFPARSNCHFSVNKRARRTRSQQWCGAGMQVKQWIQLKEPRLVWLWYFNVGFVFLTVVEIVEIREGTEKQENKKKTSGSFWSGGRRSQTMRWRIRLAEIEQKVVTWGRQETQFWCSGLGNAD